MILYFVEPLFVAELFDELVNLQERNAFMLLNLVPIMGLYDHLEQFHRAPQQLQLGVSQLLEFFLLELKETGLEDFLFVVLVSQLHEDEDVVVLGFADHVLPQNFNERLNLQEFDYWIVLDTLASGNLNGESIETL